MIVFTEVLVALLPAGRPDATVLPGRVRGESGAQGETVSSEVPDGALGRALPGKKVPTSPRGETAPREVPRRVPVRTAPKEKIPLRRGDPLLADLALLDRYSLPSPPLTP